MQVSLKSILFISAVFVFNSLMQIPTATAQISLDKIVHDFGTLNEDDLKVTDFELSNRSGEDIFLLRADGGKQWDVIFSNRKIAAGSSERIRMKFNPTKKGSFNEKVQVYVSSQGDPITLTLKGNVAFIDPDDSPACPSFRDLDHVAPLTFTMLIRVIDLRGNTGIKNATVEMYRGGKKLDELKSDKDGHVRKELPIGSYYFIAKADGFITQEYGDYFNRHNPTLKFEMGLGATSTVDEKEEEELEVVEETKIVIKPEVQEKAGPELVNNQLSENLFAANNVVFLIDVSTSMNRSGKLDLLKVSMLEMLEPLREIDRVSIVTYATGTEVKLSSMPASNKEEIIKIIEDLEAGGSTAGKKGIKKAYQVADEGYFPNGNNQIFIATDGAFDIRDQGRSLLKNIKGKAEDGITLSVIGIKNKDWTVKNMEMLAKKGSGSYISITSMEDAVTVLLENIKQNSRK
ncbi:MAG: VWA domain-containing protein [Bacteroidia bacterium]|nr:VWA domain-containing protein [Bacteroidia bacterium]